MELMQNDKKLLQKEKKQLQDHIDDLERRPEPLPSGFPESTRAALDQVRKWDADVRVDKQKKTIALLQHDVVELREKLITAQQTTKALQNGHSLRMNDVWMGMYDGFETQPMNYREWEFSTRSLHDFLWHFNRDALKKDHKDYENREEARQ